MVAGEKTAAYQHDAINAMLRYVGLQDSNNVGLRSQDAFNTIDGASGKGYGHSTREELGKYERHFTCESTYIWQIEIRFTEYS